MAEQHIEKTSNGKGIAPPSSVKGFMALPSTKKRVEDLLGERSSNFMTSVSTMVGSDDKLAACEPVSLFMAALTAAALDLPISKQLGFAHIIPYDNNKKIKDDQGRDQWVTVKEAQFQLGWRGYVQLAMRTGKYETIAATPVYEGQLIEEDPLDGNTYDWKAKTSNSVIGYVAKFKTTNGFKKEVYMSQDEVEAHAERYSKAYGYDKKNGKKSSPWSTNFEAMALKTVIKQLISKWGIMSIELEKAVTVDSAVIKEDGTPSYLDGEVVDAASEKATEDQKSAIISANTEPEEAPAKASAKPKKSGKSAVEEVFGIDNDTDTSN